MKKSFSGRDRRAVLLGTILLLPPALYRFAVRPYMDALAETRDRTVSERSALARERALLALAPRRDTIQHALDSVVTASEARLFNAPDAGIATAELGAYLSQLARQHNVWLRAADPRDSKVSPQGVRTLPIDIRAESDFEGLRSFLHAMERGDKLVRVDQLIIAPGTDTSSARPVLELRATITGYALGAAPPQVRPTGTPAARPAGRKERP
jgi:hypothetical protein